MEGRAIWEEDWVLGDSDEALAERGAVDAVVWDFIDQDRGFSVSCREWIQEFENEGDEARFPAPGASADGHFLAGLDGQFDVVEREVSCSSTAGSSSVS